MTTTELVHRTTAQVDPADAARLSKSKLVPEHLANDAASAEYMMRIAAALGLEPINAFQHIFVFPDGKGRLRAGMSAHLMHALAVAAGHELHIEGNATQATAVLIRHTSTEKLNRFRAMREEERRGKLSLLEDTQRLYTLERDQIRDRIDDLKALAEMGGEGIEEEIKELRQQLLELSKKYGFDDLRKQVSETRFDLTKLARFESTWTVGRATKAGLNTKDVWQAYGPEMLKARAKVSVIRDGAIDVILGIKHIMGDLGLEFSEDVDDSLAVGSVLYTPEELGADVDQDGVPLKGRVVNVTAAGVSKTQDRFVAAAKKLIEGKSAQDIKAAVDHTVQSGTIEHDIKISRLDAIAKAVAQTGKGEDEVSQGDATCTLSAYLEGTIHALNSSDESDN